MPDLLASLYRERSRRLRREMDQLSPAQVRSRAQLSVEGRRPFRRALERAWPAALVAELKRASPSAGVIQPDFRPAEIASSYQRGGACALSVLTEESRFGGRLEHLGEVRRACQLPLLRKDFLTTEYELAQSAAAGADAVLAIAAGLSRTQLGRLLEAAREWRLDILVEVHQESELERALGAGARLLGVNNRDLRTLRVDPELTLRLLPLVPEGVVLVSESGYSDPAQVRSARALGVGAFLVGEALMRAADPAAWLAAARGLPQAAATEVPG